MDKDICESIEDLEEEIKQKQDLINTLKTLDVNEVLTEDKWHQICETGLRASKIMEKFLLNIFPDATNVKASYNEVNFNLYGFDCAIPTSRCRGIEIDTSWYFREKKKPELYIPKKVLLRVELINAKKNHLSWYKKALIREQLSNKHFRKLSLFFAWFFNWKWEKSDEEFYLKEISDCEERFNRNLKRYEESLKEKNVKLDLLFNKLIPTLSSFSSNFSKKYQCQYNIEEIKKYEKIS